MNIDTAPKLPSEWEKRIGIPFDGLFGDSAVVRILQEFVSDPYSEYRPKDIEELTELTEPTVRTSLNGLLELGIICKVSKDPRRPVYKANHKARRITALTFLAYAIVDDRDGTNIMDASIVHYCDAIRPNSDFSFEDTATFEDIGFKDDAIISADIPIMRVERM